MKRSVLLAIDDDRVTEIAVVHKREEGFDSNIYPWRHIPVPSDDQMTQDLLDVTAWILGAAGEVRDDVSHALIADVAQASIRIRDALGLDEESE